MESQLAFHVPGRVVERLIDAGEIVTQGQALRELNARGQKCYSSIELLPNFADTGEAYLMGLAITDSPASIGTEKLQSNQSITARDGRLISSLEEFTMSLDTAPALDVTTQVQTDSTAPEAPDYTPPVSAFSAALEGIK